jgi:hypothetical protein
VAKILNLQAPKSMQLRDMKSEEVASYVAKHADEALKRMPDDLRPVGINAVALSQRIPGTSSDPGFWAEWTRACCDRRAQIEDFTDPVIEQFERPGSPVTTQLHGEHLETQMRVQMLEHPTQHTKE